MKIGYARVSTLEQNFNLQLDALRKAGCQKIYKEKVSGAKAERPEFTKLLNDLRKGDTLIVWKLDRLGRSLIHLVDLIDDLTKKGIALKSLNDPVNTGSSQGRLVLNIFASLAEFERDLIRERTLAGLASARARGRFGGRPKGLTKQAEATACAAKTLYKGDKLSVSQICDKLDISKATLYKYLRIHHVKIGVNANTKIKKSKNSKKVKRQLRRKLRKIR
jgi:DNA invertase Pin-like site-specific DNA recombinase